MLVHILIYLICPFTVCAHSLKGHLSLIFNSIWILIVCWCSLSPTHTYTISPPSLLPSNLLFNCHDMFIFYCNVWMFCMWLTGNSLYKGTSQCWISRPLFVRFSGVWSHFVYTVVTVYSLTALLLLFFCLYCPSCCTSHPFFRRTV